MLEIKELTSKVEDKEILKGLNLTVNRGEVHVIMGPNGAGKSTLANILMGHPKHIQTGGEVILDGESLNGLRADERAKKGVFLSFQYPEEIPGVTVEDFLRTAKNSISEEKTGIFKFRKLLDKKMEELHFNSAYADRHLNVGFSGGEKKKKEVLQMSNLKPKIAILDETDSGLDVDAIKVVYEGVTKLRNENNSFIIITHYNKVLQYLKPDFVHVLYNGKIVKSGGIELAEEIETKGYEDIKREF